MKPFYSRDGIVIYCGDNAEVMKQWDAGSIDLTVTSPPYDNLRTYNGYSFDFPAVAGQLYRVTAQGGVVVWVVGDATINGSETGTSFRQALGFMGLGFNLHDTMIYQKTNGGANGSNYCYIQAFEYMFVFSKETPRTVNLIYDRQNKKGELDVFWRAGRRRQSGEIKEARQQQRHEIGRRFNIWPYQVGLNQISSDNNSHAHPAIFPESLARDHIISWSNEGDLVCDPFLGSGTTAKMAQQLGRRFIGCEISEEYCRIAVDRLRQPSFFSLPTSQPAAARPSQLELTPNEHPNL